MTCLYCDRPAVPHAELCKECLRGRDPLPTLREDQILERIFLCPHCKKDPCICRCPDCELLLSNCVCSNVTRRVLIIECIDDEDVLDDDEKTHA